MKSLFFSLIIGLFLFLAACATPPDYPIEPYIEFISLSKNSMLQSSIPNKDSTLLTLYFTDGDGDLGSDDSLAIFLIDKRDDFKQPGFRIPFIGEQGVGKGISGELYIAIPTTCCYFEDGRTPCEKSSSGETDEVIYEIYIKDRAGNMSNKIDIAPITLRCD
jgi:hypothetical protein